MDFLKKIHLSRHVVIALLIGVVMITVTSVAYFGKNKKPQQPDEILSDNLIRGSNASKIDSDGDGLENWEELLWGTDPNNAYSNPDNINDFDYVEKQRSQNSTITATNEGGASVSSRNLNETELLGQEFLKTILSLKESGNLTAENVASIGGQVSATIKDENYSGTVLPEDITIIKNPTETDTYIYKKNMQSVFSFVYDAGAGDELSAVDDLLRNQSTDQAQRDITYYALLYKKNAEIMEVMNVPFSISKTHLSTINHLYAVSNALLDVRTLRTNSIVGLQGLYGYQKYNEFLEIDLGTINRYLNGISI